MAKCALYKLRSLEDSDATLKDILLRRLTLDFGDHGVCRYDRETCGCWGNPSSVFGDCRLGLPLEAAKQVYDILEKTKQEAAQIVSKYPKPQQDYTLGRTTHLDFLRGHRNLRARKLGIIKE